MAGARKCDRCGTCFDPLSEQSEMARFRNPIFQTADNLRNTTVGRHLINSKLDPDIWIDLCPSCTHKFDLFMMGTDVSNALPKEEAYTRYIPQFKNMLMEELVESDAEWIKDIIIESASKAMGVPVPMEDEEDD